jgi:hypothetical protein
VTNGKDTGDKIDCGITQVVWKPVIPVVGVTVVVAGTVVVDGEAVVLTTVMI